MPPITVDVKDFHPYSGHRNGKLNQTVLEMLGEPPGGGGQWLLLFEWPADATAFAWMLTVSQPGGTLSNAETEADAVPLFEAFNIPKHNRAELFKKKGTKFRAVLAPTAATIDIQVTVNTNRPEVRELVCWFAEQKRAAELYGEKDERFTAAEKRAKALWMQLLPPVSLYKYAPHSPHTPVFLNPPEVKLVFRPDRTSLTPMIGYDGFVAFDLGNTGSMLAHMDGHQNHPDAIRLLKFKVGGKYAEDAVPTAVRVNSFTPPPPPPPAPRGHATPPAAHAPMPAAVWEIGQPALTGSGASGSALVLGAKRLLSDPDRTSPGHPVLLGNARRLIPKELPAELFITSMVEQFHALSTPPRQIHGPKLPTGQSAGNPSAFPTGTAVPPATCPVTKQPCSCRPGSGGLTYGLAVTCPTTFTDREISNLRKAVYSGWRRALGEGDYRYPAGPMEVAIPLVLDEASAAAMFFVFRDLIHGPGRDRALHYLYPNGVNILVYDCGGGTTDIALVHVYPVYTGEHERADMRHRVTELHVDVIGRTGHRGFGGDTITEAVFAVLKAKLAAEVSPDVKRKLEACKDPTALAKYLTSPAGKAAVDAAFPTHFNFNSTEDLSVREKARVVLTLWKECGKMKERLGLDPETSMSPPAEEEKKEIQHHFQKHGGAKTLFKDSGGVVRVAKAEVDALVEADISTSIRHANGLIRRRMWDDGRPARSAAEQRARGGEVHRVYVTGNASKYPTIRQRLMNELDVAFLQEQRFPRPPAKTGEPAGEKAEVVIPGRLVFDEDNLKGAVAKGAVAAMAMKYNYEGVQVRYDNQLTRRLPFEILYRDRGKGDIRVYREGQLYEVLANEPKFIDPPARDPNAAGDANRMIKFYRQWPDEPKPLLYLTFTFADELVGQLKVEYIPATETSPPYFQMTDEGGNGGPVRGVEVPEAQYVSPPQSGLL